MELKNRGLFFGILIGMLIMALAILVIVFAYKQPKQSSTNINYLTGENKTSDEDSSNIDKLKLHTSARYGYSIKYPNTWFVEADNSELDYTARGPEEDQIFIGGDTVFSNYPAPTSYTPSTVPEDLFNVVLFIYRVDSNLTFDQFIKQQKMGVTKKETIQLAGLPALKITSVPTGDASGIIIVNTLVKVGTKMFVFGYNWNVNKFDQQNIDLADQLIKTFALTK